MQNPYFSFKGYYFQTPGSDIENAINKKKALTIIYNYITSGGHHSDVEEAMQFLKTNFAKSGTVIDELSKYIFIDDLFGFDEKEKICLMIFRKLVKRVT